MPFQGKKKKQRFTMGYFYSAIWLGGRSKDIMEAISRGMKYHSTTTRGSQFSR
jgi:hypothetical protein